MLSVVADVGGTNIRLAVCCNKSGEVSQIRTFACAEFLTLDAALFQYFSTLSEKVSVLCLAIACPVEDDLVSMTNLSWQFSKLVLKEKLQLEHLFVINDYTGISLAVPFLTDQQKIKIGQGEAQHQGVTAIFGPGTGLGVSHLIHAANKWLSLDGEGGHMSVSPNSREQADVLLLLQAQFGHVSAERLLSGQGLVNIYHAICRLEGKQVDFHEPKQVTEAALNKDCSLATRSLTLFCEVMGGFAGNLALNLACTGGVYIAGGIVPRFVEFFKDSEFRTFFEAKGRFSTYLATIPTYVITHDNPGLLGATVYLRQELGFIED
ncbi:glucokinase [Psychromonas sp. Urea-02u-13]|uniref:glucokinase n=1 Tax=Psychromonas sp. Urea-02u-13 TaxID=2058326 RepID=UPI000C32B978|nr:glucokinase [Psychromonas sp. Urea-02u-13]PKG37608.1 glucokinase [Psychromonas sp. Urea-02u-13]